MKKLFTFLLLSTITLSGFTQIKLISKKSTISIYDEASKKYGGEKELKSEMYITWENAKLTLVCPKCTKETRTQKYAIVKQDKTTEYKNGSSTSSFTAVDVENGNEYLVMLFYNDKGLLWRISMLRDNIAVSYDALKDY